MNSLTRITLGRNAIATIRYIIYLHVLIRDTGNDMISYTKHSRLL